MKQIEKRQALEAAKFETAKQIRAMLDALTAQFPADARGEVEGFVLDLVTEEA